MEHQNSNCFEYLGRRITRMHDGSFRIDQFDYVKEIIYDFGDLSKAPTPCDDSFLRFDDSLPPLEFKDTFSSMVARLLWLARQSRPDILFAVVVLCTRVSRSNKSDYEKLTRIVRYLNNTRELHLVYTGNDKPTLTSQIDAAHGIHTSNMLRGHTGHALFLGHDNILSESKMQSINTLSSTETEVVAVSDSTQRVLHAQHLLQELGEHSEAAILYQDNISSIHLLTNGKPLSMRSRHIPMRTFWVKQYLDANVIKVQHLPAQFMTADILTKSLSYKDYSYHRAQLLNIAK